MLLFHCLVLPPDRAEEIEVAEGAELNGLEEDPDRHPVKILVLADVLGDEVAGVRIVRVSLGASCPESAFEMARRTLEKHRR